jgi:hypothetical protein
MIFCTFCSVSSDLMTDTSVFGRPLFFGDSSAVFEIGCLFETVPELLALLELSL